ncbi:MAG: hypothetical protein ACTHNB_04640 [Gaiellaceae bacterium]
MHLTFLHPRVERCRDCGAAVARASQQEHACDREQLVEHQLKGLEDEIDAYLASPRGRFELWWATRERCSGVR